VWKRATKRKQFSSWVSPGIRVIGDYSYLQKGAHGKGESRSSTKEYALRGLIDRPRMPLISSRFAITEKTSS
jgi:hypothetical protein